MTPTEIEVWQTVVALNRTWTSGNPEQLVDYFHADIVAITPTDPHRLEGREACIAGWTEFVEQAKVIEWKERDPLVTFFGDSAVVTYYYEARVEMGGKVVELTGRDMLFMVKENGKRLRVWRMSERASSCVAHRICSVSAESKSPAGPFGRIRKYSFVPVPPS
jgi:hypothetical protein